MAKQVTEERFDSAMDRVDQSFVEVDRRFDKIDQTLEGMATILQRLDQERIFTIEWVRRIESDVSRIKGHLKIA